MSFTRTCVECGRENTYKSERSFNRSQCDSPVFVCRNCKISRKMQEAWQNPAYRKRKIAQVKQDWEDPEYRKRQVERIGRQAKERWADPDSAFNQSEYREKCADNTRRRHALLGGFDSTGTHVKNRPASIRWKNQIKERDNWTCQECEATEHLHAHHIKRKASHPELAYDIDNGITLCVVCHAKKHPRILVLQEQAKRVTLA